MLAIISCHCHGNYINTTDIVSKDGVIDRKALGAIVFADKSKLEQLTDIVWPEIWRLAHQQIGDAWNQGDAS